MAEQDIYTLSPRGRSELQGSATGLQPGELDLLIRFDGHLTWEQVRATLSADARASAGATLGRLLARGLLQRVEPDPFELQMEADARRLAGGQAAAGADAGLAALQRSGFYVQIARERGTAPPGGQAVPVHVMLVEDDRMLALFTRNYLKLAGFEVRVAGSRAEILAQIRQPPTPGLFLLDVELPDVDGFGVLYGLRQHPVLRDVPAIMLTARATREAVLRGLSLGADGYITKPFDPDTLLKAVRTVLGAAATPSPRREGDPWSNPDTLDRRGGG